jgi:hypothetical protein
MTDEQIKKYINDQIKDALKTHVPRGPVPDDGLLRQLDKLELLLKAAIVSLLELPPELDWKANFSEAYRTLRKKQHEDTNREISAGIAELEHLMEQEEPLES